MVNGSAGSTIEQGNTRGVKELDELFVAL